MKDKYKLRDVILNSFLYLKMKKLQIQSVKIMQSNDKSIRVSCSRKSYGNLSRRNVEANCKSFES